MLYRVIKKVEDYLKSLNAKCLVKDSISKYELLYTGSIKEFFIQDFMTSPELEWFREILPYVRSAFGSENGFHPAISRIIVVERLHIREKITSYLGVKLKGWFAHELVAKVVYDECPTLYITKEGTQSYLTRFEEICHAHKRRVSYQKAELSQDRQVRYFEKLLRRQVAGDEMPTVIDLPIHCHKEIYESFMSSQLFAFASSIEQNKARKVASHVSGMCRKEFPQCKMDCHC